jgi:L-2-hydroxyglutarate oxidase LhgO
LVYDFTVVGGGIVGLSAAWALLERYPGAGVVVLEKDPAFWRLAGKNWKTGVGETFRPISKKAFVGGLKRLVPEVEKEDLVPTAAGVRARALRKDGSLVDNFFVVEGKRSAMY